MAYNDYGAFVRRNGERMEAHEGAVLERLDGGSGGPWGRWNGGRRRRDVWAGAWKLKRSMS